jgi:hypothetical protein
MLAAARGARIYSCDEAFGQHAGEVDSQAGPTLRKVLTLDIGDRLDQPIDVQVEDVFRLYREEFPLIVRDLAAIRGGVVVEGAALLPELLAAHRIPPEHAVWLVPTEDFQRWHYERRGWAHDFLAGRPELEDLFDRWMRRDAHFAVLVAQQARELGYQVIVVDGSAAAKKIAATVDTLVS